MIPNNNLSVLPWYRSIQEQNARRWWVYNRVYPLFCPALYLLPFQIMRDTLLSFIPGSTINVDDSESGIISPNGEILSIGGYSVNEYQISDGVDAVYFANMPKAPTDVFPCVGAAAYNNGGNLIGTFTPEYDEYGYFTGGWVLPHGTVYIFVQSYNGDISPAPGRLSVNQATTQPAPITEFKIYTRDGVLVGDYTTQLNEQISIKAFNNFGYDVIIYPAQLPLLQSFANGQYYAVITDGTNTWYSEIFTAVNDIEPYLKIEWYDNDDFVMDAGRIVYKNPAFKNVLYLDSAIAKPEYIFEEEGENRDGYFFPFKQISEKRFRFKFFASEYLLDVMRFIRMADYATIYYHGQRYSLDTFLITPEWEDNGDVASVEAIFDTATVAKKIGVGYIKAKRGDFNDDFNDDFNV